jgi:hypothetical protein
MNSETTFFFFFFSYGLPAQHQRHQNLECGGSTAGFSVQSQFLMVAMAAWTTKKQGEWQCYRVMPIRVGRRLVCAEWAVDAMLPGRRLMEKRVDR